jgi:hypothetical protein
MPRPLRRRPKPDRRRALELLASCRDACTEAIKLAHGFTVAQMVERVNAGMATATAEQDDRGRAGADHRGGAAIAGTWLRTTGLTYMAHCRALVDGTPPL